MSMPSGQPSDVTATLTDIERKLVDLERQLGAVAELPAAGIPTGNVPVATVPSAAQLRLEGLRGEIADLVRFRDRLEATARDLICEYERLVEQLRGVFVAAAIPPAAVPPAQGTAVGVADAQSGQDSIVIDAGPFRDIATLTRFQQALTTLPAAHDVELRGFEGDRAMIHVRLARPDVLATGLAEALGHPVTVGEASAGRVVVHVDAASRPM